MRKYLLFIKILFFALFLFIGKTLLGQEPFVCQNNFYFSFATNFNSNSQMHEVKVNQDGSVDFIPLPQSTGARINGIGYRSTDNFIYGIGLTDQVFYRIDATGRAFQLTVLDVNHNNGFYAAEITPEGDEMIILEQDNSIQRSIALLKVDLTDNQFPIKERILLNGPNIKCTDIAFDPVTGLLYAFDEIGQRLITIDKSNGTVATNYPRSPVADEMGGLYIDAFGNMFGYGNATNDPQARTFFGLNKITGAVEILATGPSTVSKDGCSCPFTIDLLKDVSPRQLVACTEITYTFEIANVSGQEITGLVLRDTMPTDFTILRIDKNPYGGIISGIGTNILSITDMIIPIGMDTLKVVVEALPFASGVYQNQAYLENLPESLGSNTPSDDPNTITSDDPTTVEIFPLTIDLANQQQNLCEGSTIELVGGTIEGIDYLWNNGSTSPTIQVNQSGLYAVTITNGCETEIDSVFISEEPIAVDLGEDIIINLGDYANLIPTSNAIGQIQYIWTSLGQTVPCPEDCSALEVRPFFDTDYELQIVSPSGCTATTQVHITVTKERGVFIPNVFSPNLDGINDRFYIMGKGYAQILVFQVFDRWGNMVFATHQGSINDESIGWDGVFDGRNVDSGVFGYYAKLVYLDGIEEVFFGDVTVVR